jgi:hypothetical protein
MTTTVRRALRVADHSVVSIIIAAQFLGSLFFLLSTLWMLGLSPGRPNTFLLLIAYWSAGIATAVFLQEKGRSWLSPPAPPTRRRVPALLWNAGLVTYLATSQGVDWHESPTSLIGYFTVGATAYLAFTCAILLTWDKRGGERGESEGTA